MKRDEVSVGDLVTVYGYGGFAEVLHIEQDGYTPPPNSVPKYRVTVKWGPNNSQHGSAKTGNGIQDFALGRCEPAVQQTADKRDRDLEDMDEAALLARLAQLKAAI